MSKQSGAAAVERSVADEIIRNRIATLIPGNFGAMREAIDSHYTKGETTREQCNEAIAVALGAEATVAPAVGATE